MGCACWGPPWWMQRFFLLPRESVRPQLPMEHYLDYINGHTNCSSERTGYKLNILSVKQTYLQCIFFFKVHTEFTHQPVMVCTWSRALFIMSHESKQTEMATDKNFIACRYCSQTQRNSVNEAQTFMFIGRMAWPFKMGGYFSPVITRAKALLINVISAKTSI